MMRGEFNDGTVNVRRRAELAIRSQLQLASAKFEPVEHFLNRMRKELAREYGQSILLQRRGRMQPTALNTFEVRYSHSSSRKCSPLADLYRDGGEG
jgi:hypothetical protein